MEMVRLSDINFKDHIGEKFYVLFLLKSFTVREYASKQGEFIILTMRDKSTEEEAKIWTITEAMKSALVPGTVYEAIIEVKAYEKAKCGYSCTVTDIASTSYDSNAFIEWNDTLESCNILIQKLIERIHGTIYGSICKIILQNNWNKYAMWVAGKAKHHTELGSLLCHSVSVASVALKIAEHYNSLYGEKFINIELLVSAGLLHDIGKIHELAVDIASGNAEYTSESVLRTHIMNGMLFIDREAIKSGLDPNSEEIALLEHLIASHHGRLEWGSPIEPNIPEAVILHNADMIDAEMWRYNREFSKLHGGEVSTLWSNGKANNIYKEKSKEEATPTQNESDS